MAAWLNERLNLVVAEAPPERAAEDPFSARRGLHAHDPDQEALGAVTLPAGEFEGQNRAGFKPAIHLQAHPARRDVENLRRPAHFVAPAHGQADALGPRGVTDRGPAFR